MNAKTLSQPIIRPTAIHSLHLFHIEDAVYNPIVIRGFDYSFLLWTTCCPFTEFATTMILFSKSLLNEDNCFCFLGLPIPICSIIVTNSLTRCSFVCSLLLFQFPCLDGNVQHRVFISFLQPLTFFHQYVPNHSHVCDAS